MSPHSRSRAWDGGDIFFFASSATMAFVVTSTPCGCSKVRKRAQDRRMVADASKDRDASDNCNANEWEFLERWARQLEKNRMLWNNRIREFTRGSAGT